ncbi:MAG TPA: bis(5'-nucleosyl)-tetraphosphatase (symmetrical) YqeK [Trueperaceae bacterium]|nr:bis(5'-nucleosyl)-tetraphosphatase (symmetrical) YqeK [Trueperaceae bacterium]
MVEPDPLPEQDPCARPEIAAFCPRVEEMVSSERYEHIQRVARLAVAIARANGFPKADAEAACLAAILHDAARDLSAEELFRLAPPENALEERQPLSVHGRAARVIAASWGVDDARVLEAIEGHVFGVGLDNRIGMAVYIADVCEPGRGVNDDIRELAMKDLTRAYEKAVGSKVQYLRSKGKSVHPATLKVYEQICH